MLKRKESSTMTLGIAAEGGSAQGVEPFAAAGTVVQYLRTCQSLALPIRLIIAQPPQADIPELLVC
jgi:hypothetical protein